MNDMRHTTYQAPEWETRQTFVRIIDAVCKDLGIKRTWLSDSWIAHLQRGQQSCYLHGYIFPLNNAAASAIIRDKVATSIVLNSAGVAAIPHALLRLQAEPDLQSVTAHAQNLVPLPMVIKPNAGASGGYDVIKCTTNQDVAQAITDLASRHRALAVSPFTEISHEYRVVMLDGQVKVMFEKQRRANSWQHNLKLGASPLEITNTELRTKLTQFAAVVMQTLQARLAAVDIVDTPQGLQIMEVNSGITLDRFSAHSEQNARIAHEMYADIVQAALANA